jgi:hypothetical protein
MQWKPETNTKLAAKSGSKFLKAPLLLPHFKRVFSKLLVDKA